AVYSHSSGHEVTVVIPVIQSSHVGYKTLFREKIVRGISVDRSAGQAKIGAQDIIGGNAGYTKVTLLAMIFIYFKQTCKTYFVFLRKCFVVVQQVLNIISPGFGIVDACIGRSLCRGRAVGICIRAIITVSIILSEVQSYIKSIS